MAPSNQSPRSQLTHRPPPLQNGGNQDGEGAHEERGLACKAGSEGCLPLSADESSTYTSSEIPMAESNVSIQHTSIWTLQCPLRVYKTPQTSSGDPQEARNQSGPLLGRHAYHGKLQGGSPTPSSNSNASPDSPGIYPQPQQERFDTHSKSGFLGILLGLSYLANLITNIQNPVRTADDQRDSSPGTGNCLKAITAAGINDINSSSNSTCSIVLSPFGESQDNSSEAQSELQHSGNNIGRDEEGANLVAPTITQTQRQINAGDTLGHGDRVRCINTGLGSESQQHQYRRSMDTGESMSHQLSRVAGSISSPKDLCHQFASQDNPPEARQCDGNCLSQQNGGGGGGGGDSFSPTLQSGGANLEMVLGEKCIHPRRTPPRETQCESRLALSACTGLQRLADAPDDFSTTSGQAGPLLDRSVCIPHECPAPDLLQLETGSIGSSNRCPIDLMDRSSSVPFPTIFTPQPLPGENQQGEGGGSGNSSSVEQPGMVPIITPESTGCTDPASQHNGHHTEPSGRATPTGSGGSPPASRMACIRQSYGSKGLSDRVVSIMQKSWRKSTESAYSSVWRQWSSWCDQQQVDPVSAPLNMVLDYLTELYEEGKQYRTINTARSAISMTHDPVDGWKVGQQPLTIRFLKGIFNSRPPAPRYTTTWDVDKVLVCIHNLPKNSQLSLTTLTHKLAMLMALTNADRCSELASLDLTFRAYLRDGVKFVIPGLTKTRKSGPPKEVFYPSYPEDVKLCPVKTLEAYELRTKPLRLLSKEDSNRLFLSVRKPHAPVKAATIGHWLQKLMAQAGIDVSIFSAHSTRGAATSKAKNVGVSTADILKTADWSSVSTFRRFYQKPIKGNEFGRKVLECLQT